MSKFHLTVVAVDASGVREVVTDGVNGKLLASDSEEEFAHALNWVANLPVNERKEVERNARTTALGFSISNTASKALELYESTIASAAKNNPSAGRPWDHAGRGLKSEWQVMSNIAKAAGTLLRPLDSRESGIDLSVAACVEDTN